MESLGQFLARKRKEKSLTIRSAASLIGVSSTFLYDLETGGRSFPVNRTKGDLAQKIGEAYELSGEDKSILRSYAEAAALEKNRIPADLAQYLRDNPSAQIALRVASEKKLGQKVWDEIALDLSQR